mmetsp:Transcript_8524/g.11180  ORF Transcript_8524/g.11180 Transcript_8524/m.11180 type:complete len:264 (+) Transcript_8524:121-912(+)
MAGNFGAWFDELKKEEAAKERGDAEAGQGLLGNMPKLPVELPRWLQLNGLEKKSDGDPEEGRGSSSGRGGPKLSNPKDLFNGFVANLKGGNKSNNEADQLIMGLSYKRRFQIFVAMLVLSVVFFALAFLVGLPTVVLRPHKFAVSFTLGSLTFMAAFAMLKGPTAHLKSMCSRDRLPFSILYVGSMFTTLYACFSMRSYIFAIVFSALQLSALLWYLISYIPGGSNGMKYFFNAIIRTAKYMILPCVKGIAKGCNLCCKAVMR